MFLTKSVNLNNLGWTADSRSKNSFPIRPCQKYSQHMIK